MWAVQALTHQQLWDWAWYSPLRQWISCRRYPESCNCLSSKQTNWLVLQYGHRHLFLKAWSIDVHLWWRHMIFIAHWQNRVCVHVCTHFASVSPAVGVHVFSAWSIHSHCWLSHAAPCDALAGVQSNSSGRKETCSVLIRPALIVLWSCVGETVWHPHFPPPLREGSGHWLPLLSSQLAKHALQVATGPFFSPRPPLLLVKY